MDINCIKEKIFVVSLSISIIFLTHAITINRQINDYHSRIIQIVYIVAFTITIVYLLHQGFVLKKVKPIMYGTIFIIFLVNMLLRMNFRLLAVAVMLIILLMELPKFFNRKPS